ncbi:class I SAM-dependent methyltransferase [Pelagibacterales bacterium SAG-MED12]|nr:class I SAM-dependent methyltransferase [Pelagibacterales bacterium SAG-MED12]
MFILKLKYFVHYYKSKILKKKCKKNYKDQKIKFEYDIKEKNFSNKWFLNNFDIFNFFLPKEKNSKFDYLEVGCFEGLSSFFVLSEYKAVNAILLDIWDMPNPNSKTLSHNFNSIEKAFDNNLSGFDFMKIKDDSVVAMRKLFKQNKFFDFIYIDGSHNGEDILSDAIEAFKILKKEGLIFFDDFLQHDKNRALQSYDGIEKFLNLYSNYLKIEYFQNNLVVRKK